MRDEDSSKNCTARAYARTKPLKRFIIPSDEHDFVGRIYDLSIVGMHFSNENDLLKYDDCKYALDVNESLSVMTRRIESLNVAGNLIWPDVLPTHSKVFPIPAYQWLNVASDVFLMRYISVFDYALILTSTVLELGLDLKKCSIGNLKKNGTPQPLLDALDLMLADQGALRAERNSRFHHGYERGFTDDDLTFRTASLLHHLHGGVSGTDQFGRKINIDLFLKRGLVEIQREFNQSVRSLAKLINPFYDKLSQEFEIRFSQKFKNSKFRQDIGSKK